MKSKWEPNGSRSGVLLIILIAIFFGTSCSPFKPRLRFSPPVELPQNFSLYTQRSEYSQQWWKEFEDPDLNGLIEQALAGSFTLKRAWARLKQAQALTVRVASALYPDLRVTTDASYAREGTDNGSKNTQTIKNYAFGLLSSYELDLWGRIHSEQEASNLEATATAEDLNAAAITLAAEVTDRWVNIISQRMQKCLLQEQLETNMTYMELVELRFRKAMVSALDVYQQKQIVEQVRAEIPLIEAKEQLFMHDLALLLGKPPRKLFKISRETLPIPALVPATGLPADLLSTRPDVRATGLRLRASEWQVAAARADRLPAISLTAKAGYDADELDKIFDHWLLRLAGNLVAPIFDGKRRAAEVERTRAVVDENLSNYRETVLIAIKEVEDALINETKQRQHIQNLELEIDAARSALKEARKRYRKGLIDYLPVLTQLLTVQRLERERIQKQTQLIIYRIDLYRALGGTWTQSLKPDAG